MFDVRAAQAKRGAWARIRGVLPERGAPRALALSTFVGQTGSGLLLPVSALFFTRSVGLTPSQVGIGLASAGLVGLVAAVPMGRVADRFGARGTYAAALLVQAFATASFALMHSLWAFLAVSTVAALAERGGSAARGAVIGGMGTGEARVRLRAMLKSVTNAGLSIGTALAAFALAADSRGAYLTVIFVNAAAYVAAALPLAKVPSLPSKEAGGRSRTRRAVLKDRPYALVTVACGVTSIHYDVLSLALPLWIAGHTTAPKWGISAVIVANTVLVVLLQVPFSRGTGDVATAAVVVRRSGWVLGAGWTLIACVTFVSSPALALALLVAGMTLHTAGELWHAAGAYGLSYELAPAGSHGEYQGFFSLGRGVTGALAPIVLTTLCLAPGADWRPVTGWLSLGLTVTAIAALVPSLVRRAQRTGTASPAAASVTTPFPRTAQDTA
ncbi:MFS transporter [Streptomyces sp. HSG2]|uniref:MFS transporter n=1 Tax=Streptomyces sp. HSG2 TaxID=2797167 RepID=UPI0019072529|nr:MFS transporter [Streptomyces sp. HSG2]